MRRCFFWMVLISLSALLFVACSGENQAYTDACAADTAESYKGYIEQFPDGMHIADVRHRLDLKDFNAAEAENTAAAFEKYLADHPDGKYADNAMDEAKNLAWNEAEKANTVDAMVAFKEKYGTGAFGLKADTRLAALRYAATSVRFEEMVVERINVGGDRRADPDGYVVRAKVTNSGEQSCKIMKVRIVFLDADINQADQ